jgi:hypothetical protein
MIHRNASRIVVSLIAILLAAGCASGRVESRRGGRASAQAPVLLAVRNQGQGNVEALWKAPVRADRIREYRLYVSAPDGRETQSATIPADKVSPGVETVKLNLSAGETRMLRLEAIGTNDKQIGSSAPLAIRVGEATRELMVVGDVPNERSEATWIESFAGALGQLEQPFDSCLVEALLIDGTPVALTDYHAAIWSCGEETNDTLTASEQQAVASYLDEGGRLFLCGGGLTEDLNSADAPEGSAEFYRQYLKAFYDPAWAPLKSGDKRLEGAPDEPRFAGLKAQSPSRKASRMEAWGGSSEALYYQGVEEASAAAVAYVGGFGKPMTFSRLVYLGTSWEMLRPAESQTEVLKAALEYLEKAGPMRFWSVMQGSVAVEDSGEGIEGAKIELLGAATYSGSALRTMSREQGEYQLLCMVGTYQVRIGKEGFEDVVLHNVKVRHKQITRLDIAMKRK